MRKTFLPKMFATVLLLICSSCLYAATLTPNGLRQIYLKNASDSRSLQKLQESTLALSNEAVPVLIEVMKDGKYPEKNRWMATFLLGRIMGDKAAPLLARFLEHPHWMLRTASLKTLLILKQTQYANLYARSLSDPSLIVRTQALENIRMLKLKESAPAVWQMLYDKDNYVGGKGVLKRGNIIKSVVRVLGELEYKKAHRPFANMIQKKNYQDLYPELDVALAKVTGRQSPQGAWKVKQDFWSKTLL